LFIYIVSIIGFSLSLRIPNQLHVKTKNKVQNQTLKYYIKTRYLKIVQFDSKTLTCKLLFYTPLLRVDFNGNS